MVSPPPVAGQHVRLRTPVRRALIERLFFTGFAVAAAAIVFIGFSRTFYLRSYTQALPLAPLVFVHGLAFTSWVLFLLLQTGFIFAGHPRAHRRAGVLGGCLAAFMLVVGFLTAIEAVRRGFIAGGNAGVADPLAGLAISLRDLFVFAGFTAAGLYYRRNRDAHKRLMVLATINLLPAAVGRMPMRPVFFGPLLVTLLLAGPVHDRLTAGRVHWVYVWGGWFTFLTLLAPFPLGRTEAWHRFAGWLIR